jgi:hypothetical protein
LIDLSVYLVTLVSLVYFYLFFPVFFSEKGLLDR